MSMMICTTPFPMIGQIDPRNTDGHMTADAQIKHGGAYSLKITQTTATAPNVFSMVFSMQSAKLEAGKPYTLSALDSLSKSRPKLDWRRKRLAIPRGIRGDGRSMEARLNHLHAASC